MVYRRKTSRYAALLLYRYRPGDYSRQPDKSTPFLGQPRKALS